MFGNHCAKYIHDIPVLYKLLFFQISLHFPLQNGNHEAKIMYFVRIQTYRFIDTPSDTKAAYKTRQFPPPTMIFLCVSVLLKRQGTHWLYVLLASTTSTVMGKTTKKVAGAHMILFYLSTSVLGDKLCFLVCFLRYNRANIPEFTCTKLSEKKGIQL